MHASALREIEAFRDKYLKNGDRVADIGSRDPDFQTRKLLDGKQYTGFDIQAGPCVYEVMDSPDLIPAADETFDAAICANTLEHARKPWILVREMARILKSGGFCFLLVPMPNAHPYHAHPIDCWRCYTEGMRGLFEDGGLTVLDLHEAADHDTVGIARK